MVRQVRPAERLVQAAIVLIHVTAGIAKFVSRRDVIDELRVSIVGEERKPVGEAALRLDEHAVIRRIPNRRVQHRYVAELRERAQCLRLPWPELAGQQLIDSEVVCRQVMAHVGEVSRLDEQVAEE